MSNEEDLAYRIFSKINPHESYADDPERFWRWFTSEHPGVSRDEMERTLAETSGEKKDDITDIEQRMTCWIRDFGHEKQPQFISDLKILLHELARLRVAYLDKACQAKAAAEMLADTGCTCPVHGLPTCSLEFGVGRTEEIG